MSVCLSVIHQTNYAVQTPLASYLETYVNMSTQCKKSLLIPLFAKKTILLNWKTKIR